jgi:tetratricopeptide (TPR) repeat protein
MARTLVTLVIAGLWLGGPGLAAGQDHQHDHGTPTGRLGTVHFETSCAPAAQKTFDRGVALLHSFWFSAAVKAFDEVLASDPNCVMAHWGKAMSWWSNPFAGMRSAEALKAGLAAIDAAKASGGGTPRERDYIAAVDTLFRDAAGKDQRSRTLAYEKAMEALAAKYPDDVEARIFYALALGQTALPTDKSYANQLKAADILEREFAKQPDHPGLAHYIIHSFDVPPLAPRALNAARRYATIAPDAPHALHMPSHTFTRVGLWQESIDTNLASAAAARKDNATAEELHALDYQAYAYLQIAQDASAKKTVDAIPSLFPKIAAPGAGNAAPPAAGYFAAAAIPARYALERAAWAEAAAIEVRESPTPWADAVTWFAKGLGAARTGDTAAANAAVARLAALGDKLSAPNDGYWRGQVEIQRRGVAAWAAFADGRADEALTLMREAADMEDATEKAPVTPGPIKPARELLGEMLLELKKPSEALAAFESTLKKEPNRFRAIYGAANAADAAGDHAKAKTYYANLIQLAGRASASRKELDAARRAASLE